MRALLFVLCFVPLAAGAAGGGYRLDRSPHDPRDLVSLQAGARTYMNYCLGCHSLQYVRYGGLADLGLTEAQIKDNLMFTAEKVGEPIKIAVNPKDAKSWFGVTPPDLSVGARSRSPDWLYTYLRGFYRDPATKTGWNNTVFPNVGMPHVLWEYQGDQALRITLRTDPNTGDKLESRKLALERPGTLKPVEYDQYVADLVNFMTYLSEPAQTNRKMWGIVVLFFLAGFVVIALLLKGEYWKDVR